MKKNGLVIAIDGPSGAGKSTLARLLADRLGYVYIDTGGMYRSLGWKARQEGIDPADERALADLCGRTTVAITQTDDGPRFLVDGRDVSGEIRTPEMGMTASSVSKSPAVRQRLLVLQRELGRDAEVKFFLGATAEERGRRRYRELAAKGMDVDLARITTEIRERDHQDSSRALAPLVQAPDAAPIDSTGVDIPGVLDRMLHEIARRFPGVVR